MDTARAIKIVGWTWTIIGGGMILTGAVGTVFLFLIEPRLFPPEVYAEVVPNYAFLRWFRWAYPIQFFAGIFVLICGRKFLKRHRWPRKYLEGMSWFFLAFGIVWPFVMAFGLYWIEGETVPLFFAIPVILPYVALFGFSVYQLRSEGVRGGLVR